ncbi:MAG: DUF3552 domain-containing protein, partial [Candidatus Hydrogenedentes bacterium]|nr:DUF3552 domain-containing protein [Candidatus Hydrogenedentota bacterium]
MTPLISGLAAAVAGIIVGAAVTFVLSRIRAGGYVSNARREAAQALTDAEREVASIIKDGKTSVKEVEIDLRAKMEKEGRELRKDIGAIERRITGKEEKVDRRAQALDKATQELSTQERALVSREKDADKERNRLDVLLKDQMVKLEGIAGLTAEQARKELYVRLENEVKRDCALELKRVEEELRENAEKKGRWIIGEALQRCAADHVAETTVSVVPLPNDEMKGRIIGREGRNIRALESATGINVIIDDTPEAVVLSGFDPVRREIARIALERLIEDGRIHPARIEEMVEK